MSYRSFTLKGFFPLGWNDSLQRLGSLQGPWAVLGCVTQGGRAVHPLKGHTDKPYGMSPHLGQPCSTLHFPTLFSIAHSCSLMACSLTLALHLQFGSSLYEGHLWSQPGQGSVLSPSGRATQPPRPPETGVPGSSCFNPKKCEGSHLIKLPMEESEKWYWKGVWSERQETWVLIRARL